MRNGLGFAEASANDAADHVAQSRSVLPAQRVRLAEEVSNGAVVAGGALIGEDEEFAQKLPSTQLVDAQDGLTVDISRNAFESHRRQIRLDQRHVCGQPCDPFVGIVERLQVGNLRGSWSSTSSHVNRASRNFNSVRSIPSGWAASAQFSPMTPTSSFFISPVYQLATSCNCTVTR